MTFPFQLKIDEHLELRQRLPEDVGELFALTDANRAYLREWLPWLDGCVSPDDTLTNIESSLKEAAEGTGLAVTIRERGQIVGVTGFNMIRQLIRVGQIGYWLGRQYQGRGIMTRAVKALVGHGFDELALNRITIAAATGNRASRAVAERLGFHLEGIAREAEWLYDRAVDHAVYAMIRSDWATSAAAAPSKVAVRALNAADLPAAITLWNTTAGVGLAPDETIDLLTACIDRNPRISSAAVNAKGTLVGAVLGGHDGRRGYLYHLAVDQAHRGGGLGRELVRRTTERLAQSGISRATIFVYADNDEGREFWEHLGWKPRTDLRPMQVAL